ncbi:Cold-regulated 413 inner membrane protein 2, chloroplastic [Dendrobium catenatum]|uniref:Cold-regulated 413 inner membrane protein 2, chloroplastic n=1 Tax=Dendrobium catenatum TaxID=906689 RepID=A0A2I0WXT4_9ASPA|nr:Cold-regulated 413 inner membrane protein 2, chloroplastic [Dendrobium catenatum]
MSNPSRLQSLISANDSTVTSAENGQIVRGSQAGTIVALAAVIYLAFQHFSKSGSLEKAFDQVSIIATLAIICLASASCLLLF